MTMYDVFTKDTATEEDLRQLAVLYRQFARLEMALEIVLRNHRTINAGEIISAALKEMEEEIAQIIQKAGPNDYHRK